jgi:glycosyltransferase involved in cell wall biosynthesis
MVLEQNRSLRKFDKILSVDSSLVRYSQQFFYNKHYKIHNIYNFVDLTKFHSKDKTENKKFTILYPRNISFAR